MNLKPIILVVFPEYFQIQSNLLGTIQKHLRKSNPDYWILTIISPDTDQLYMEIFSWRSTSYLNYASLLQLIDEHQYEKLERYRQNVIMGTWEYDLGEDEEEDLD